jgi:2-oxoisovalerate dehydrogenase E2 component (dihydrolipoyl transacylase)
MANVKDFLLPDLGEGLTEGEIVSWLVAVGDTVELNQPVAEIETAKAVVEVPTPFAGTITRLHGEVGDEVAVGTPLITIDLAGATTVDEPSAAAGQAPANISVADAVPDTEPDTEPDTPPAADEGSGNVLVGYGTGGGRSRRRRGGSAPAGPAGTTPAEPARPPGSQRGAPAPTAASGPPLAKPPVRKLAKDLGVDLAAVTGTGPQGTITRADVESFAEQGNGRAAGPKPAPADQGVVVTDTAHQRLPSAPPNPELEERIPVRGVRKAVAAKMSVSRREIPDATTWVDVDATALWKLRDRINAEQDDVRVSPLAIVLRACVAGLREFPEVNARLDTDTNEIVLQRWVNLGVATQTDRGLVVPVIKGAEGLSTLGIAAELTRLAAAAREGRVTPEELTGGTFTVSNYGSFGVDGGSAVINHPEAAILGVGRITDRPWVHNGSIKVRKVMQLSIAFDHRICDGAEAAGFLRFIADAVERPARLLAAL